MKLHRILFPCLLLVLPVMATTALSQTPATITESKLLAIVDSVDRASRRGNVAGIIAPLAKDVKIRWTISSPASTREQVLNFNRDQYAFYARQGLRKRLGYTLERKNTRVKIYEDGKTALVMGDVYETLTVAQGTLRAVSSESTIYTLRGGRIVATSVEVRSRFY